MSARFPEPVVAAIREGRILRIRAGTRAHRPIGIWAVVVDGRVFVRSWSVTPRGWYRTLREEPIGTIQVEGREIPVRAVFTRSRRLEDLVSRAYLEKYDTPGTVPYARDLGRASSRKTTTELTPRATPGARGASPIGGVRGAQRTRIGKRGGAAKASRRAR